MRLSGVKMRLSGVKKRLSGVKKRLSGVKKRLSGVLEMLRIKQANVMNNLLTSLTMLLCYYVKEKFLFSEV